MLMQRTLVNDTVRKAGETVMLKGWVDTKRDHGKITFIDLRDRSGKVQVVGADKLGDLHLEDVVQIEGLVKRRPEKMINSSLPTGTVEIEAVDYQVLARAAQLPIDLSKEDLNLELPTLLDYRSLALRHPKVKSIFKVQEVIIDAFRRFLQSQDFVEFQAPNIISEIPEGGAEVFPVKYFEYEAYLSQSPQLYKSLLVSVFERVFSVNKIFRAEPSVTTRHLTEVVSLDAEMGFIDHWTEVMEMAEATIKFIFQEVESRCGDELKLHQVSIPKISDKIPHLTLREAQQIIFERTGRDVREEKDLAPEDEREICRWASETKGSELVFISHYLTKKKPFYTYADEANPEFNQGFDLLGRGTEWLSGGRRVHDYQELLSRVKEWGMNPEKMELYLQAFRFGMPPLGGFAFGAERITMHILELKNIREASLFPRDMERVDTRLNIYAHETKKQD